MKKHLLVLSSFIIVILSVNRVQAKVSVSSVSLSVSGSVVSRDLNSDKIRGNNKLTNGIITDASVNNNTSISTGLGSTTGIFVGGVPTITSFSPISGAVGTTVTISGSGFNTTAANNIVFFGATKATVTAGSAASLTVIVPMGATYQNISVTDVTAGLTAYSAKPFNVTYANGIISQQPKTDFNTGANPYSVAIGDLDGDGKPDLAVVNILSSTVSIYRNTSAPGSLNTASFAPKFDIATDIGPVGVAIGDLDSDGKPDLVVVNTTRTSVSIYRNLSTPGSLTAASFEARVDFITRGHPLGVAIGDLDGDGNPDLAVTNFDSNNISIFRNANTYGSFFSGSFSLQQNFTTGKGPTNIAIGDLDGDGKPDLAVTNQTDGTVSVFRNTATAGSLNTDSFAAKVDFATGAAPCGVAIGDLDGDGKPDLTVANSNSSSVSVIRNTSAPGSLTSASFSAKVDFATGLGPNAIAIGDLDGDGKPDLVVTNNRNNTMSVIRNTSASGSFTATSFAAKMDFTTGSQPLGLAIGDLDGDNKPDLVAVNYAGNTLSVFHNGLTTPTTQATNVTFTNTTKNATLVNWVNGNGASRAVFIAADTTSSPLPADSTTYAANAVFKSGAQIGTTGWYCIYNGTGTTVNVTGLTPNTNYRVMVLEYNGTVGKQTYLTTTGTGNPANVSILAPVITSFSPSSGTVGTTVTISGSGFNATAANNIVFFGATKATVTAGSVTSLTVTVPTGATFQNISVTDVAAGLTGYSAKPFNITYANGIISQQPKTDFNTGTNPYTVAIGDLDGDGIPDLAVTSFGSNTVSVYRNTSAPGSLTAASFADKIDFATGSGPRGMAIGDLDGDGKPDLAVVNEDSNTLSVYRNTAAPGSLTTASFAAKMDFATGSYPAFVAIGDLDGDGKPDLAVTNQASATVSVYRNTSAPGSLNTGSFAPKVDFAAGGQPVGIAIGDLDGDGKSDMAVASYVGQVNVYRNTSTAGSITTASFAAKVNLNTGSNAYPWGIAIGDLDGDGKPELAVANSEINTVAVYRNMSTPGSLTSASFGYNASYATGSKPETVAIADLDGDDKPDLVVANNLSNTLSVFRNKATPGVFSSNSFAAKADFATGDYALVAAIGDLDGDGRPDLVVTNFNSGTLSVFRNGLLAPTTQATNVTFTNVTNKFTTSWTNGNGANRAVFIAATTTGSPLPVDGTTYTSNAAFQSGAQIGTTGWYCIYNGTGTSVNVTGLTAGITYRVMAVEYNGTGGNETYLTTPGTGNPANVNILAPVITSFSPAYGAVGTTVTISGSSFNTTAANNIVFFGATKATVTAGSATSLTVTVPFGATYQDISVTDLATGLTAYSAKPFSVTYANGIISQQPKADFATGAGPFSVAIGDLDGDGKSDLAVVNYIGNTVSVYRNTSAQGGLSASSYAAKVDFVTGTNPVGVAIGDLDGDGKPELAVVNGGSNTVSVYRNASFPGSLTTASFAAKVDFTTGVTPIAVAISDLDGDDRPDLAVVNQGSNTLSVIRNISVPGSLTAASFAAKVDFTTGASPRSVAVGDLDGDGKPDLAVTNIGGSTVSIIRNTATPGIFTAASFTAKIDLPTGSSPYSVSIGDLDGDGKPDLAVANYGSNTVSVIRNTSAPGSLTTASFAPKVDLATGSSPIGVAIGDLDGDGKPDLVVANNVSNSVSVIRNVSITGSLTTASFAAKVDFTTGTGPIGLAVGDMDGDGKPDLAATNSGSSTISVLRNGLIAPTTQATNVTFTNTTATKTTASWTIGNGSGRAVFIKAGTSGSPAPADLTTYTANPVFGSGSQIGTTGWYCVYNGTGTTVNITGLAAGNYQVMVVEYSGGNIAYLTTSGVGNPASITIQFNSLDVVGLTSATPSATAYSLRKLSSAYIGKAVNVRRSNDGATIDIGFNTIGGLDTAALKTFVGANSAYVTKWYDQSGNGYDMAQATATLQPRIVNAGVTDRLNGLPAVYFGTANLATVPAVIFPTATSMVGFAKGLSAQASAFITKTGTASGTNKNYPGPFDFTNSGSTFTTGDASTGSSHFSTYPTTVVVNTVPATVYSFVIPPVGGSGVVYNNGNYQYTQNTDYYADNGAPLMMGNRADGGDNGNFLTPEIILFNSVLSTADKQAVETSQKNYYNNSDATLSSLTSTAGTLSPAFASNKTSYSVTVPNSTSSVTVTPVTTNAYATASVNGSIVSGGSASQAVALLPGSNTVTTVVTAQNTAITNTYTITVNRAYPTPTIQATAVNFTNTTTTSATVNWTSGNGTSRAVFILAGNTGAPAPVNNTTYAANTIFASGDQIASTGWYCIYNGTGNTVNITGLSSGTTYRVMVVEYNGTAGLEQYQTTAGTGNPANINMPVVATNVTSTTANGSYNLGNAIPVTITFTNAVIVTGTPQLTLATGSTPAMANYTSGSGTNTLTFTYTVQAGNNSSDLDYTSTTALSLNGGTLTNNGNPVFITLPAPGTTGSLSANKAIVIDTRAPTAAISTLALSNDSGSSLTDFVTKIAAQTIYGTLSAILLPAKWFMYLLITVLLILQPPHP